MDLFYGNVMLVPDLIFVIFAFFFLEFSAVMSFFLCVIVVVVVVVNSCWRVQV